MVFLGRKKEVEELDQAPVKEELTGMEEQEMLVVVVITQEEEQRLEEEEGLEGKTEEKEQEEAD